MRRILLPENTAGRSQESGKEDSEEASCDTAFECTAGAEKE